MKLYDAARVGGDILSYCGKCKMDLAHVVIAMVDTKPVRVMCKTCRSEHRHKIPTGVTAGTSARAGAKSKTPRASAASRTTVRAAEYWEQKLAEKKSESMIPYDVKHTFTAGQVMDHPQFGPGIIQEVKRNGKIVVLFKDGDKILVHALQAGGSVASVS